MTLDPSKLQKLAGKTDAELRSAMSALPESALRELVDVGRAARARGEFSPDGFRDYFWCINGMELPDHAFYGFILPVFYAKQKISREKLEEYFTAPKAEKYRYILNQVLAYDAPKAGTVVEASREMAKTVVVTVSFFSYFIGHHPHTSSLLIQAGDTSAQTNASKIAEIIERNAGWKAVFPTVVPDESKNWGEKGYFVKDTKYSDAEWVKRTSTRLDASFRGVGYSSDFIVGKHPNGIMMLDDIQNENNTSSEKEMAMVKKILIGTIFYAMTKDTWVMFIGTPWKEHDALAFVKETGEYVAVQVPARRKVFETGADVVEFEGELWQLMWAKERGEDWLKQKRALSVKSEFARMVDLDLSQAQFAKIKYYEYPADLVRYDLPTMGGADPTNVDKPAGGTGQRSYFALAYVAKLPQGGALVVDGVLEQCSQLAAENYIKRAQSLFSNWQLTAVEGTGGGAGFIQTLRRDPSIRVISSDLGGFFAKSGGNRDKKTRLEREMFKWFENGTVRIAANDTPFLNALRRLMNNFFELDTGDYAMDAGDAVYHALKAMPDVLRITSAEELPDVKKKKAVNPFSRMLT